MAKVDGFLQLLLFLAVVVLAINLRGLRKRVDRLQQSLIDLKETQMRPCPVADAPVADVAETATTGTTDQAGAPQAVPGQVGPDLTGPDLAAAAEAALSRMAREAAAPADGTAPPAGMTPAPEDMGRPVVLTPDLGARLAAFLQRNWVYVVSAVSLALAGVFLVQYGIESGILTPWMRVAAAIALGAALILGGERLRRRANVHDGQASYLPATFSGAGIVAIFAGVLAARQIYDLIGPAPTLAGLVATAGLAIGLGWFNGSFLAGIGLLGAAAAPFLTGGGGSAPDWFYAYYVLVAAIGLTVDTMRRWAWVSALAMVLAYAGGGVSRGFGAGETGWMLLLAALPVLATVITERALVPRQAGPSFVETRFRRLPSFPVRLVAGSVLATSALLVPMAQASSASAMVALIVLAVLAVLFLLWASEAEGLADLPVLPALAFLALIALAAWSGAPLYAEFEARAIDLRPPETAPPGTLTWIVGLVAVMVVAGAVRSWRKGALARDQGRAAVVLAGAAAAELQFHWDPVPVTGPFLWALMVMGLAALTAALALDYARRDGGQHSRTATAGLMALTLVALSLSVMTSGAPLVLALSALVVAAAWLDRRFDLPEMTLFLQAGAAVLTYRIVVDPGVFWAESLPMTDFLAGFLGPVAAGLASLWLIGDRPRPLSRAVMETATALWKVGFLDAAIVRWLDGAGSFTPAHMGASLFALPWIGNFLSQSYRAHRSPVLRRLRLALAGVSAVVGLGVMALAATVLNPLLPYSDRVIGPPVADSLALAYLVPGLVLLAAGQRLPGLAHWVRWIVTASGIALVALALGLEIRRLWQGPDLDLDYGVLQGELYTYTVALMLVGAGLLVAALTRRSATLRRAAMTVIALTIAKVFLIDAAGLSGLTRVISFLGLGLSLAGLAWLNGVIQRSTRPAEEGAPPA